MKVRVRKKMLLLVSLAVVFVAVLGVSLYNGLRVYLPQKQEQNRFDELRQVVEQEESAGDKADSSALERLNNKKKTKYAILKELNDDFKAWIHLPETEIDYPVMKSSEDDPEFYLRRDFDKNYSFSGTPFIGGGCNENSDIFIIYGHNMKNGTMFTDIDKYDNLKWANEYPEFTLVTLTEERTYKVFASFKTKVDSEEEYKYYENVGNFDDDEYDRIVGEFSERSLLDLGGIPDSASIGARGEERPGRPQLLILSTCSYHTENGRFVVVAYRVE